MVTNPPFVISPEPRYIYRDSGLGGDEVLRTIVRQAPVTRPRGLLAVLCNWAHVAGQEWDERLATWTAGTGCDAWVLRCETFAADAYAVKWIRPHRARRPGALRPAVDAWWPTTSAKGSRRSAWV